MSGLITRETADLFDPVTGAYYGVLDLRGNEVQLLTASTPGLTPNNVGVDVGAAGIVRQPGAMGLHNGAGRGTLVANNLVVCDATAVANSWKQLSNTALVF